MIDLSVCVGSSCHIKGSYSVVKDLQRLIEEYDIQDSLELKASFCLGSCGQGVSIRIGEGEIETVQVDEVNSFFNQKVLPLITERSGERKCN